MDVKSKGIDDLLDDYFTARKYYDYLLDYLLSRVDGHWPQDVENKAYDELVEIEDEIKRRCEISKVQYNEME